MRIRVCMCSKAQATDGCGHSCTREADRALGLPGYVTGVRMHSKDYPPCKTCLRVLYWSLRVCM